MIFYRSFSQKININVTFLFQIERVRHDPRRVHADVRAVPIPGDTLGPGDPDRSGLRPRRERLRLQAQELHELVVVLVAL